MNELVINNRESLIKRITASLREYVKYVRTLSKENFNDNAVLAETEFMKLMNFVYGWNLVNANIVQHNTPGFDLIDEERKIIVQVSVSDNRNKINHTLGVLKSYKHLYDGYHLLFFFISTDTFKLRNGSNYQGIPSFLSFDHKTDILDVESLNQKIEVLRNEQLEETVSLSSRIFDIFPFFDKNKDYQNKRNQLDTVIAELFNVSSYLKQTPDNEYLKERQRVLSVTRQSLEEQLFEDTQHILALAKHIAELKGQKITKRTQRAIAAFEAGDIATAKVILAEADHDQTDYAEEYVQSKAVTEEKLKTAISKLEEKNLRVSVIMAVLSVPINDRIHEALTLWKSIDADAQKIDYATHEPDKNDELLDAYYAFLRTYGYYQDALTIQERLLKFREMRFGEEHEKTAASFNDLGCLYLHLGQYTQALLYLEKSVAFYEKELGKEHPFTAIINNNIGLVHYYKSEYTKSLDYHKKALAIYEKVLGKEHPYTATSYNNIGRVYKSMGEYTKALEYYEKALAIREKVFGTEHPNTATSYDRIGLVYKEMGDYPKALGYYEKALAIKEKVLGSEHPDSATLYNNIGMVYNYIGEYTKALEFLEKALAIREKVLGTEHPDTASSYNNIGMVYDNMGEYPKALEYYLKALAIWEKVHGTEHPDSATSYNNIGLVYESMGEYTKALEYFEKALAIFEKVLGPNHPRTKTVELSIEIVKSKISG